MKKFDLSLHSFIINILNINKSFFSMGIGDWAQSHRKIFFYFFKLNNDYIYKQIKFIYNLFK